MVILPTKKDGGSLVRLPGQSRENNNASFFCWSVTSVTRTDGDSFLMSSRGRLGIGGSSIVIRTRDSDAFQ